MRQPFSVNALAQAAGAEAILHQDDALARVEGTIAERLRVEEALRGMGFATSETQANFSWVDLGELDEAGVVAGLAEREVAVRPAGPRSATPATSASPTAPRRRTTASSRGLSEIDR